MTPNLEGFNLIEVSENVWVFEVLDGESFTGSLRETILFAVRRYHLKLQEIEVAIETMIHDENNAVHFGMWGTFIYSFNKNESNKQMVS